MIFLLCRKSFQRQNKDQPTCNNMADDPSKSKEQQDREAKAKVTMGIIDDPGMAALIQKTGKSSQNKREENRKQKDKREKAVCDLTVWQRYATYTNSQ